MGEVIYGVVFGKPVSEENNATTPVIWLHDNKPCELNQIPSVFGSITAWWDWPSDTEPPNEPA